MRLREFGCVEGMPGEEVARVPLQIHTPLPSWRPGTRAVQTRARGGWRGSREPRGCFRAETPSLLMVVLLLKVPGVCSTVWDSGSVDLWRTPVTSK